MTLVAPPRTPSVAIARALRALGLQQGKDFRVTGHYVGRERRHTYVILFNRHAEEAVAANVDRIEQSPELGGFAFTVSVRYVEGLLITSIRNGYCERVRETAPAEPADDAPAPVRAEEAPAATEATEVPTVGVEDAPGAEGGTEGTEGTNARETVTDWRARWRREEQAKGLGWSTRHAELVSWAAAGQLVRDADGTPRRITRPGRAGARVNASRTAVLEAAGYLVHGPDRIEATADGRQALAVWEAERPTSVERTRKQERLPLAPLLYGDKWRRDAEEFRADVERRRIERERWYADFEVRRAEEEREERLRRVWAVVEGIRNPCSKRPRGWAPTDEDVRRHFLAPGVVAELRAEAAEVAAEPAAVEGDTGRPGAAREPRTELTCVLSRHTRPPRQGAPERGQRDRPGRRPRPLTPLGGGAPRAAAPPREADQLGSRPSAPRVRHRPHPGRTRTPGADGPSSLVRPAPEETPTMLPDRFLIDDGRHLPEIVVDEDASTAAGAARWRASCSCGRMPTTEPGAREQALAAHVDHARTRLGPTYGPAWLPVGARIVVLLVLMLAVALGCYAGGLAVINTLALTGPGEGLARVAAVGLGFGAAFTLMVAARHFIAPTRT